MEEPFKVNKEHQFISISLTLPEEVHFIPWIFIWAGEREQGEYLPHKYLFAQNTIFSRSQHSAAVIRPFVLGWNLLDEAGRGNPKTFSWL